MKKYLLVAVAALFALPLMTSCGGPSGDPKKDAESFKGIFEKQHEVDLEMKEKALEVLEYYADKKDAKALKEFSEELDNVKKDVANDFEKENRDKVKDMEKKAEEAEKKLGDASSSSDE